MRDEAYIANVNDWARDFIAAHGIETTERTYNDDTAEFAFDWRPDTIGSRKVDAIRIAGWLRRGTNNASIIRDFLEWRNAKGKRPMDEAMIDDVIRSAMRFKSPRDLPMDATAYAREAEEESHNIDVTKWRAT